MNIVVLEEVGGLKKEKEYEVVRVEKKGIVVSIGNGKTFTFPNKEVIKIKM